MTLKYLNDEIWPHADIVQALGELCRVVQQSGTETQITDNNTTLYVFRICTPHSEYTT